MCRSLAPDIVNPRRTSPDDIIEPGVVCRWALQSVYSAGVTSTDRPGSSRDIGVLRYGASGPVATVASYAPNASWTISPSELLPLVAEMASLNST